MLFSVMSEQRRPRRSLTERIQVLPQPLDVRYPDITSDTKVQRRVLCEATHIFMYETLAREYPHLPCFPIGFGIHCWTSNIGLALGHELLFNLFRGGITIVDNLTSPSIYNIQHLDQELIPRFCKDMIAQVVRLIRSSRGGE